MLSRALSLATVMLLVGCFAAAPARAQAQNLEAGKSPSQIFAGTCTACHKSPRGLLKTVPAGSLPGFLRQHYTTSGDMASLLSSFLISNGATDTRYATPQSKPGKDASRDAKPEARSGGILEQLDRFGRRLRPGAPSQEAPRPDAQPQQAARPDVDESSPGEAGRQGRNAKRLARPEEAPDAAKPAADDGQAPAQAASERGPDGRKLTAKQRLSKRGRPGGEEPPKTDAAKSDAAKSEAAKSDAVKPDAATDEPAKSEAAKDDRPKSETAKETVKETAKDEDGKPEGKSEGKSEAAKVETPNKIDAPKETGSGETPVLRADPVPPVTPAPPASLAKSAAVSSGSPDPAAAAPPPSAPQPAPAAVTASAPPPEPTPAPVTPAGPPVPPISK
jgi:hypothetical protein